MILALDAMGGDHGPSEVCRGAIAACEEHSDLELVLVGNSPEIEPMLDGASRDVSGRISIVHAEERIGMDEHPTVAIRKKRHSSLRIAMEMVRSGEAWGVFPPETREPSSRAECLSLEEFRELTALPLVWRCLPSTSTPSCST